MIGGVTATCLITKYSLSGSKTEIRDALVNRISHATAYAYLENFQVCAPEVICALGAKLKSTSGFKIVFMISHMEAAGGAGAAPTLYLTRMAYVYLLLMSIENDHKHSTKIRYQSGHNQPDKEVLCSQQDWRVAALPEFDLGKYISEDVRVTLRNGSTGATEPIALQDILSFERLCNNENCAEHAGDRRTAGSPRVGCYCPALCNGPNVQSGIYVHSKLTIIDKQFVFMGSANHNNRSMVGDGELNVEFDSAQFCDHVKSRIFPHYSIHDTYDPPLSCWVGRHTEQSTGDNLTRLQFRSPADIDFDERRNVIGQQPPRSLRSFAKDNIPAGFSIHDL